MLDLVLRAHTVERFECEMTPAVANLTDNSDVTMNFLCQTGALSDEHHGILRVEISVKANNPGEKEAFAHATGVFHVAFESVAPATDEELIDAIQSSGIQIAMPIIRAIIVGVTNMLGLPEVFSFSPVDYSRVEWKDNLS